MKPTSLSQSQRSLPPARCLIYLCTLFRTYTSVDPAPPTFGLLAGRIGTATAASVKELRSKLLDTQLPLFERYRAMFALRNIGTPEAVDALAAGFSDDSALFK
jgi:deoxyhypusine monooxygenase